METILAPARTATAPRQSQCLDLDVGLATPEDIRGMLDLQEQNLLSAGGTLSVGFSRSWFEKTLAEMPVVVARKGNRVVGYVLSSSLMAQAQVAIVQAMLRTNPVGEDAYLYGPICIAETERGRGLADRLFSSLKARLPGREAITFIRRDNVPSLRAHTKMGMRKGPEFAHEGVLYVVMSYGP